MPPMFIDRAIRSHREVVQRCCVKVRLSIPDRRDPNSATWPYEGGEIGDWDGIGVIELSCGCSFAMQR
jgi:hypothetical protein